MTNKRNLHITVDLDGIVADLATAWLDLYNEEHGHGAVLSDLRHWDTHLNVKIGDKIYDYLSTPGLFLRLNPLPGAIESLEHIQDQGHEVHIVTAATEESQTAADKVEWCKRYLPFIPRQLITTSHQKHRVLTDVFIDDSPKNQRLHAAMQPRAVRMGIAWPYNEEVAKIMDIRAESYEDTKRAWELIVEAVDRVSRTGHPTEVGGYPTLIDAI